MVLVRLLLPQLKRHAAKSAAPLSFIVRRDEMKKVLPPTYFLVATVLMVALHFAVPLGKVIPFPWRLLGLVPLVVGVFLNIIADRTFKRYKTTVKPFERSRALITGGVFKLTRNPMYLGMVMILTGIAVLLGSATPWLMVLILCILLHCVFIKPEEQMLEATFGDAYREYRRGVRRWI